MDEDDGKYYERNNAGIQRFKRNHFTVLKLFAANAAINFTLACL